MTGQLARIFELLDGGEWWTLDEIAEITEDPTPSISAQLRHLRKPEHGGHTVNKRYVGNGLYRYQLQRGQL